MNKKADRNKAEKNSATHKRGKKRQWFPSGWDEQRVRQVLDHYESQTDEERAAEIEAAYTAADHTLVSIPNDLVPAVMKLIARHGRSA